MTRGGTPNISMDNPKNIKGLVGLHATRITVYPFQLALAGNLAHHVKQANKCTGNSFTMLVMVFQAFPNNVLVLLL